MNEVLSAIKNRRSVRNYSPDQISQEHLDQIIEAERLGIPAEYKPFYGIAFGYKTGDKAIEAPKRNMDVVNYIR